VFLWRGSKRAGNSGKTVKMHCFSALALTGTVSGNSGPPKEDVELETAVLPDSGHLSSEQSAERSIHGDAFR
jgi:hypothetical protein